MFPLRTDKPTRKLLYQKGMKDCKDIIMHLENPNRCLFIILNIGPEAMAMKYECEFTVKVNDLEYTAKGTPTTLLPGIFDTLPVWSHVVELVFFIVLPVALTLLF